MRVGVRARGAGCEVRKHGKRPSYFGAPSSGYSLGHLSIRDSPRRSASSQARPTFSLRARGTRPGSTPLSPCSLALKGEVGGGIDTPSTGDGPSSLSLPSSCS